MPPTADYRVFALEEVDDKADWELELEASPLRERLLGFGYVCFLIVVLWTFFHLLLTTNAGLEYPSTLCVGLFAVAFLGFANVERLLHLGLQILTQLDHGLPPLLNFVFLFLVEVVQFIPTRPPAAANILQDPVLPNLAGPRNLDTPERRPSIPENEARSGIRHCAPANLSSVPQRQNALSYNAPNTPLYSSSDDAEDDRPGTRGFVDSSSWGSRSSAKPGNMPYQPDPPSPPGPSSSSNPTSQRSSLSFNTPEHLPSIPLQQPSTRHSSQSRQHRLPRSNKSSNSSWKAAPTTGEVFGVSAANQALPGELSATADIKAEPDLSWDVIERKLADYRTEARRFQHRTEALSEIAGRNPSALMEAQCILQELNALLARVERDRSRLERFGRTRDLIETEDSISQQKAYLSSFVVDASGREKSQVLHSAAVEVETAEGQGDGDIGSPTVDRPGKRIRLDFQTTIAKKNYVKSNFRAAQTYQANRTDIVPGNSIYQATSLDIERAKIEAEAERYTRQDPRRNAKPSNSVLDGFRKQLARLTNRAIATAESYPVYPGQKATFNDLKQLVDASLPIPNLIFQLEDKIRGLQRQADAQLSGSQLVARYTDFRTQANMLLRDVVLYKATGLMEIHEVPLIAELEEQIREFLVCLEEANLDARSKQVIDHDLLQQRLKDLRDAYQQIEFGSGTQSPVTQLNTLQLKLEWLMSEVIEHIRWSQGLNATLFATIEHNATEIQRDIKTDLMLIQTKQHHQVRVANEEAFLHDLGRRIAQGLLPSHISASGYLCGPRALVCTLQAMGALDMYLTAEDLMARLFANFDRRAAAASPPPDNWLNTDGQPTEEYRKFLNTYWSHLDDRTRQLRIEGMLRMKNCTADQLEVLLGFLRLAGLVPENMRLGLITMVFTDGPWEAYVLENPGDDKRDIDIAWIYCNNAELIAEKEKKAAEHEAQVRRAIDQLAASGSSATTNDSAFFKPGQWTFVASTKDFSPMSHFQGFSRDPALHDRALVASWGLLNSIPAHIRQLNQEKVTRHPFLKASVERAQRRMRELGIKEPPAALPSQLPQQRKNGRQVKQDSETQNHAKRRFMVSGGLGQEGKESHDKTAQHEQQGSQRGSEARGRGKSVRERGGRGSRGRGRGGGRGGRCDILNRNVARTSQAASTGQTDNPLPPAESEWEDEVE